MIVVARFHQQKDAQVFADYCLAQGWQVQVELDAYQKATLLAAAPVYELVVQQLADYQKHPTAAKYQEAAWQLATPHQVQQSASWQPFWLRLRQLTGPFTLTMALLVSTVYLLLNLWPESIFSQLHAPMNAQQYWSLRWLTPALVHFSVEHLAFNLLAWLVYAGRVERRLGLRFLLGFFILTAIISNGLQWLVTGPNFGGLSGVCFALFGFAWIYGWRHPKQYLQVEKADLVIALVFLGLGFADMLWVNTANYAHLAGLVTGILLGFLSFERDKLAPN